MRSTESYQLCGLENVGLAFVCPYNDVLVERTVYDVYIVCGGHALC